MSRPETVLLNNSPPGQTLNGAAYRRRGGYQALAEVLGKRTPLEVKQVIRDSGLRGCGGAGFPTGRKWSLVAESAPFPRVLIANTDEMEPGTFKDRTLAAANPHSILEGMIIASYAVSAEKGYFFIRPSYENVARIFEKALAEARAAGFLGRNILGSGHSFQVVVHRSAGRYICGETKGLIHALEGKRPHPDIAGHLTEKGLWGQPTLINNAETLAYVPAILRNGAAWFRSLARSKGAAGNKLYTVSGRVKRPGCFELPFGTPLAEIIEGPAGGMQPGYAYKTCLPGGASTRFLPKKFYDLPLDFDSFKNLGPDQRLGTGAVIVFDHRTCLVGATLNLLQFFARESCGFCTPCREGLPYLLDLLQRFENGEGREEYLPVLESQSRHMSRAYCAFAPGAVAPVLSLVEDFVEELREHIVGKGCPFKS
jgi:NADH-quinone oxidoreductase subunit F